MVRDSVDPNKVNSVLKEFELSLKKHQPNLQELALITRKINELYHRNAQKRRIKNRQASRESRSPNGLPKKWRKIHIE